MIRSRSLLGLGAWCIACGPSADPVVEITPSEANPLDSEEALLVELVNDRRSMAGVAPVSPCAALNVAAAAHCDDMLENGFLGNDGSDGSSPRSRACDAGYTPACDDASASIGQLVAEGNPSAAVALDSWEGEDEMGLLLAPSMVVAGVGRARLEPEARWTVVLATVDHPACDE
jgi:uncharacterized protein YkwD